MGPNDYWYSVFCLKQAYINDQYETEDERVPVAMLFFFYSGRKGQYLILYNSNTSPFKPQMLAIIIITLMGVPHFFMVLVEIPVPQFVINVCSIIHELLAPGGTTISAH